MNSSLFASVSSAMLMVLCVSSCGPKKVTTFVTRSEGQSASESPKESGPPSLARARAAVEFACPKEQVAVSQLFAQDSEWQTFRVEACGHVVTYTCASFTIYLPNHDGRPHGGCVREPDPDHEE